MVTRIETSTNPSQSQTPSGQITFGGMPGELLNVDWSIVGKRQVQSAAQHPDLELTQLYLEDIRRQLNPNFIQRFIADARLVAETFGLPASSPYPAIERESWKREVSSLLSEAGEANWDGEGALALDAETVEIAIELVDRFPLYTTRPDVAATPHGEVDFDWVVNREVMLTVSVCPSKKIVFAGLFFGARLSGSEPWSGDLPHFVNCCFERLRDAQNT